MIGCSAVSAVTFLLTEGALRSTAAAALGIFASLTLAATLAFKLFNEVARFSPLQAPEELPFLQRIVPPALNLGGLLLAAIIFGALGHHRRRHRAAGRHSQAVYEADPHVPRLDLPRTP